MSSITAQQTKLDLELVPKENRIDIGKCNGRIPRGLTPREPTFQVVLDAIALTPCYPAFLITTDVPEICPRVQGREFDPLPSKEDTVSFLRELGHTLEINSLNDVVISNPLGPEMKESKAYKTYLGHTTGVVPPKISRKFKKASPSKKDSIPVQANEEPLNLKEVRKKSLKDFHKAYPSGSGTGAKKPPSVEKITPTVASEGTGDKPGVPDVTEEDSTESESESWEQDEESDDDNQEEEEFDQENESEDDEIESDKDNGMDDTTDQFDDDVDARLEVPTQTGIEVVQGESDDVEMNEAQQGNENLETTQEQVVDDAHVTITTITKKTEVLVTSSSRSSDLASKFLNFLDIPQTDAEIVSPLDVHIHHEVPRTQAPTLLTIPVSVITESSLERIKEQVKDQLPQILPKEVSNFAPPVIEKLIKESRDEVTLAKILLDKMKKSESYLTAPEHRDCYDGLKKSYALNKDFFYSYDVYSLKGGLKDKDKDEDPSTGSDRGLKKRKLSKDAEPTTGLKKKDSTSGSSKGTKSQPKSSGKSVQSEEPVFEVADSDMPQDQEGNLGENKVEPRNETAFRRDWFKKPTPPQEPTDPD
ncbi:hypothetical protein Tco_0732533 [Tanacetum coccineum]